MRRLDYRRRRPVAPVYNEDRSVAVVFTVRSTTTRLCARLRARGHEFRTQLDTEVIVIFYEERGADLVRELEACRVRAVGFEEGNSAARADRLGIKPLFIAQLPGGCCSDRDEVVLTTGLVSTELDWQALDQFLTYTFVPAPRTIYRAITKVPPATTDHYRPGER